MLNGNTIHFQYQTHVWGNKPCKWERDILFNCIFWDVRSMVHIKWVYKVYLSLLLHKCSRSHSYLPFYPQQNTACYQRETTHQRGSKGETMRHPAAQHKSRVRWGWGVLGSFDLSQSGTHGSVERKFPSLFSEKALEKLGRTAHTGYCLCQLSMRSEELKDLGGSRTSF